MKKRVHAHRIFGAGALLALAGFALGFVLFLKEIEQQPPAEVSHAQGMVVLTGGADRVADAIELFARGYADRLLITGVNQAITKTEIARLNPRSRDLIECCVDLGYEAVNTIGNAREARLWAEQNGIEPSIIVVTSNYHMPRAMAELRHEMPRYDLRAYPVVALGMKEPGWWRSAYAARVLGTEYLKYVIALARLKTSSAAA
ncbi:MAG: YdcF family protein [Hyphomicrobiales bacterium]|nr:YdcF family protein [Hyphomicrobiales bacterium]